MEPVWNHFDPGGNAVMVDVSAKASTARTAVAEGTITVSRPVLEAIARPHRRQGGRIGGGPGGRHHGRQAHQRVDPPVPPPHPVPPVCGLHPSGGAVCRPGPLAPPAPPVRPAWRWRPDGVSAALLTSIDMCKAMDRAMELSGIRLVYKDGGKTGVFQRED